MLQSLFRAAFAPPKEVVAFKPKDIKADAHFSPSTMYTAFLLAHMSKLK